ARSRAVFTPHRVRRRGNTQFAETPMSRFAESSLAVAHPASPAPARTLAQLVPVEPATKPSIRILVADDERTLRESCASVLGVEGYNVTVTGRGEEALDMLRRRPFDIVLLDLYMTPVSGSELLATALAATDASVFITGESGSGKELIAQFIHHRSRRASRPVVAVNCAALPEMLLESEMFGHCKGAFTGAVRDKPGLLETANGGTMFLDELIEMSKPIQAKLWRVIQDGVVRRVGSETTDAVAN